MVDDDACDLCSKCFSLSARLENHRDCHEGLGKHWTVGISVACYVLITDTVLSQCINIKFGHLEVRFLSKTIRILNESEMKMKIIWICCLDYTYS